jgi:shikimate kinase
MTISPNIVITGFMGTGKSTVAPLVAGRLHRPFVDTDAVICERAGLDIPAIFARDGEASFRKLEAEVCVDLAAQTGLVIATGGGALLNPDTLAAMTATGLVVCLTASEAALAARLSGVEREGRPLSAAWRDLYAARRAGYAAIPYHVTTDDKTPEQVAGEVVALWQNVFG